MQDGVDLGSALEKLILLVPFAALAVLAALASLERAPRPTSRSAVPGARQVPQSEQALPPDTNLAGAFAIHSTSQTPPQQLSDHADLPPAHDRSEEETRHSTLVPVVVSPESQTWDATQDDEIAVAKPIDKAALPAFHLVCAREHLERGRASEAADELRASIRAAVATRNRPVHAEARLELAEIARAAGDLTSACEHWQIARSLFHELHSKEALAKAEGLMRQHGCPTDWVLNDF